MNAAIPSVSLSPAASGEGERHRETAPLAAYLDEQYRELVKLRSWYRAHRYLGWWDWESENRVAVRTVVRLRWLARR